MVTFDIAQEANDDAFLMGLAPLFTFVFGPRGCEVVPDDERLAAYHREVYR